MLVISKMLLCYCNYSFFSVLLTIEIIKEVFYQFNSVSSVSTKIKPTFFSSAKFYFFNPKIKTAIT